MKLLTFSVLLPLFHQKNTQKSNKHEQEKDNLKYAFTFSIVVSKNQMFIYCPQPKLNLQGRLWIEKAAETM